LRPLWRIDRITSQRNALRNACQGVLAAGKRGAIQTWQWQREGGCLGGGARRVGVEAFFVEKEDAGTEGEEHDGEAGGDAETGDDGSGTIVAAADDDVAGDGNQKLEDAAFQEPGEEPGHNSGRISKIEIEENPPEQP